MVNKASIGRFDGQIKVIAFNDGDSVESLLDKAGLSLGSGEGIKNENDTTISLSANAVNGETYYIVGNFKQGQDLEEVKTFSSEAIALAVKDIDKERLELQAEKAKNALRSILNRQDTATFNLHQTRVELKAIDKELDVFSGKTKKTKTPVAK